MLEKLKSRKLWIAVFFYILAAIDKELATGVAPIVVTYLLSQGFADGLSGVTVNSK